MRIAIISSAEIQIPKNIVPVIENIISNISKFKTIEIVTGGCLGIPGLLVEKAKAVGIRTIAFSPDEDERKHNKRSDNLALEYFDEIKHFSGLTMRSLAMIKESDCVLMLNGRLGTLSEFTIALEEGKRVGIITNTGGISDHVEYILKVAQKEFPNQTFFSSKTEEVLNWLMQESK